MVLSRWRRRSESEPCTTAPAAIETAAPAVVAVTFGVSVAVRVTSPLVVVVTEAPLAR